MRQPTQALTMPSPGARFRAALGAEQPLQVPGAICAYHAILAEKSGFKAVYLSGGGVAAGSLGVPDLGISTLDDVLTDVRRITDVCSLPLLVDVDTGFGASAFNVARTVKSLIKVGAAAMHIEDQVGAKRCGHRPNKELVSKQEMVDRVKAAVDARTDPGFVIMARTDALAVEGIEAAIDRARACAEAGADMIFPEAMTELAMYRRFIDAVKVPVLANITEFGATPLFTIDELRSRRDRAVSALRVQGDEQGGAERLPDVAPRRHAESRRREHADSRGTLRIPRLSRVRNQTGCAVRQGAGMNSRRPRSPGCRSEFIRTAVR
jgi:methylisocitrate lyase